MTGSEMQVSIEYVKQCLYTDGTGTLFWATRPREHFATESAWRSFNNKRANCVAGSTNREDKYVYVSLRAKGQVITLMAHRVIWMLANGCWPKHTIDHINRQPQDNRLENLRDIPMGLNHRNKGKPQITDFSGVHHFRGKFQAEVRLGAKYVHLGTFSTAEEANAAKMVADAALAEALEKLIQTFSQEPPTGT